METILITSKALQVINKLETAIANSPTGVSFLSIKGYTAKGTGEVSDVLINLGVKYDRAIQKDIKKLETFDILRFTKSSKINLEIARTKLINSFVKPNEVRSQAQKDAYTHIGNTGLKVHNETGELFIYGFLRRKTVLVKGEYKTVKSNDITLAQNELKSYLLTSKFRQYTVSNIEAIKANGSILEL